MMQALISEELSAHLDSSAALASLQPHMVRPAAAPARLQPHANAYALCGQLMQCSAVAYSIASRSHRDLAVALAGRCLGAAAPT